jgi:hypothetical protein
MIRVLRNRRKIKQYDKAEWETVQPFLFSISHWQKSSEFFMPSCNISPARLSKEYLTRKNDTKN